MIWQFQFEGQRDLQLNKFFMIKSVAVVFSEVHYMQLAGFNSVTLACYSSERIPWLFQMGSCSRLVFSPCESHAINSSFTDLIL